MGNFSAYLHILIGICVYFVFAVLASLVAQKAGINLKELEGRTSLKLLGIGAAANLGALMAILLLMTWLDGKPIRSLGWDIQPRGLLFSFLAIIVTAILAWFFVTSGKLEKTYPGLASPVDRRIRWSIEFCLWNVGAFIGCHSGGSALSWICLNELI